MNLADVIDEMAAALDEIPGLRVQPFTTNRITPPAAVVALPETLTFDATYGRGADQMTIPVTVLVGKASDRASRDAIAAYADGTGPRSVKATLEDADYAACDSARVASAEFSVVTVADVEYLAATFTVEITGGGA